MNTTNHSLKTGLGAPRQETIEPLNYQALVGGLLSEMARMIRPDETRRFAPPYRLVIINSHGGVVFSGEVSRNGKVRRSGPLCKVRRSHFPANAVITDGSLATRTFRIDRPAHRSLYR